MIGDYYAELRSQADTNALPITVRTLETIIRLSTAAAKARLSTGAASPEPRWSTHVQQVCVVPLHPQGHGLDACTCRAALIDSLPVHSGRNICHLCMHDCPGRLLLLLHVSK